MIFRIVCFVLLGNKTISLTIIAFYLSYPVGGTEPVGSTCNLFYVKDRRRSHCFKSRDQKTFFFCWTESRKLRDVF